MFILFILFSDTKNSMGLVGCIEEMSHNAIAVYWNPLESPAKVSIFDSFYCVLILCIFGKSSC